MDVNEKIKKLETLPWQALFDVAIEEHIEEDEIKGKDKSDIINKLLLCNSLSDERIEYLVNNYIYGDRVTFTLWLFSESLSEADYKSILNLNEFFDPVATRDGYRSLQFISIEEKEDRIELIYTYSKEYSYIDETGHNASIWEQHRGCLWIGLKETYMACISKHEKMTDYITSVIAEKTHKSVRQLKPPKNAIERCVNPTAISRIVLQGLEGQKTVVSKAGGLTEEQQEEIDRIKGGRFDTSGSYIAEICEDVTATVKYNVKKGNLGIYKHLSADRLFAWTKNAIAIILEEANNLKGLPATEIFQEMGQEIKWSGFTTEEETSMTWFLTHIIASLDNLSEYSVQLPLQVIPLLQNKKLFMEIPRVYCNECDSYEVPCCGNCGAPLKYIGGRCSCDCGAPLKIVCPEGHKTSAIVPWYIPSKKFTEQINKNIKKVFPDDALDYQICILGDMMQIVHTSQVGEENEIHFADIECFHFSDDTYVPAQNIIDYTIKLNEKCAGTCSREKVNKCVTDSSMVCLPKLFYSVLPSYRPQPHKGSEYGDVSGEIRYRGNSYELKGIIKKNTENKGRKTIDDMRNTYLLSTSQEGQEIIRQFVEQGMNDQRCQVVAVIAPQYFDGGLKGTLRYLARLSGKKVVFVELDEMCSLAEHNEKVLVS